MTDFIQKKVEEAVIVIKNRLEIIDTKGNGWDDIKDFLRQALIEQHNRTVEEVVEFVEKVDRIIRRESDPSLYPTVLKDLSLNILNLKK